MEWWAGGVPPGGEAVGLVELRATMGGAYASGGKGVRGDDKKIPPSTTGSLVEV